MPNIRLGKPRRDVAATGRLTVLNNLADFHLRKGLDHLRAVREQFLTITDRFASFQAQWLNVHVDFPLLQRLALPITVGAVRSAASNMSGTLGDRRTKQELRRVQIVTVE